MLEQLGISADTLEFIKKEEEKLKEVFKEIDNNCELNTMKVLAGFQKYEISEGVFNSTTGYGYNDYGRDTIEKVFAYVLDAEDAIVRSQFISGTHALTVALFAS